jgi:hypothetical protein
MLEKKYKQKEKQKERTGVAKKREERKNQEIT